ncbi:MAG: DUF2891 domain-containing protein [Chitinophagaceae bacterium]|nr:DUF2891 domain-containing protein [Chitinophagaceae bacterium]
MRSTLIGCLLVIAAHSFGQVHELFTVKKDSTGFELTAEGASLLAALPLKCIDQEYPNKTSHTSASDSDHIMTPRQQHPAFYGCFDWHSCVHGHWMMIKLLKKFPDLPEATAIRKAINQTITTTNIATEVQYFEAPLAKAWERTYGWAWLLKLDAELLNWNDEDGRRWQAALQPLTRLVVQRWMDFIPKQTYPNRTGVHPNTAFGLVFALDYARAANIPAFENLIVEHAKRLYANDQNIPALWEPDGADFLSPALEEADLMRRILSKQEFLKWFQQFITPGGINHLTNLPVVSDRTDYQIVHLDGLCFSRSWCMKGLANTLPASHPARKLLMRSSVKHLAEALPHVVSGNYGGEHWLASFVVYALMD